MPRRTTTLRVAITASAMRTALGNDPAAVWESVAAGATAIRPLQGVGDATYDAPNAAQIWTEPEAAEDDPAMRILGPHGRLLDAVARSVFEAGGLAALPPERVGLFVGMGMVDSPIQDLVPAALASREGAASMSLEAFFAKGYRSIHPLWPLSMLNNVAAGQISIDLNLRGDNLVLASDADAGLRALLEGARSVHRGDCAAALVGGVSGRITPATFERLTHQNRAGVTPGEGGAALALTAAEDGAQGYILGGATGFGRDATASAPSDTTWQRVMEAALADAHVTAREIDLVFLHADGPVLANELERRAVGRCGLGKARMIESKPSLGHTGAAAAAIDLSVAVAAVRAEGRRALVLASGPTGGAGALVVEAA